jgi:outer membrane receptor protein involved in Fe transport
MLTCSIWAPGLLQAQEAAQTAPPSVEPVRSSITVVEKLGTETPASIAVVERNEIEQIPGVNLDDRLRMVPGFSLFRRSSSLVAHPTTQGVSLRGIGSTGASRSLVLWDGVPVNDPFGGWVYWTRIAPEEVDRVEISRGASTSVFGDRAMGGAIALFSREPEPRHLFASYEAGNRNTHSVSTGYSHLWSRMALSGHGRAFTTNGYYIVPERSRGPVDQLAGVRFAAGDARLDWLGTRERLFLKSDVLVEDRENGTLLQRNSTSLGTVG